MKSNNRLTSLIISVAVAASVCMIILGVIFRLHPEMFSDLVSCATSVASFLIGVIGIAYVTFSIEQNENKPHKKGENTKIS